MCRLKGHVISTKGQEQLLIQSHPRYLTLGGRLPTTRILLLAVLREAIAEEVSEASDTASVDEQPE